MSQRILDVRRDDVSAATIALQRLALALFEDLFDSEAAQPAERWFGWRDVRVLDRLPLSRLGWRRLAALIAPFLSDAVTGRKRWPGWPSTRLRWSEGAIRARLAIDAHGAEGLLIPDRLLALVARAAWEAPEFQVQVLCRSISRSETPWNIAPASTPIAKAVSASRYFISLRSS